MRKLGSFEANSVRKIESTSEGNEERIERKCSRGQSKNCAAGALSKAYLYTPE